MLLKDVIKEIDLLVGTIAKLKAASEQEMPKRSGLSYYYLRHLPVEVRFQRECANVIKNLVAANDVLKRALKESESEAELDEWQATLVQNQIDHSPFPFFSRAPLPNPDHFEGWKPGELEEGTDLWVGDRIQDLRSKCYLIVREEKYSVKLASFFEEESQAFQALERGDLEAFWMGSSAPKPNASRTQAPGSTV